MKSINAASAPEASGSYSQAALVEAPQSILFVSGQIPETVDGAVPDNFDDQARLVWANVAAHLDAAGMGLGDVVKVTTFLGSRDHREANSAIRQEILGPLAPALTVIICDIYDEQWMLEIEVVAVQ